MEALGALADGRVFREAPGRCRVLSSEGDRTYTVVLGEGGAVQSDDNGTVYRGYVGYPIIACLMAEGALPLDRELADRLAGVPWRRLNEQYRNYASVMEAIYRERKLDRGRTEDYIDSVISALSRLGLKRATLL